MKSRAASAAYRPGNCIAEAFIPRDCLRRSEQPILRASYWGWRPMRWLVGAASASGITAALLARAGVTGPAQVFEGRWGLFATHVQDPNAHRDFTRIDNR